MATSATTTRMPWLFSAPVDLAAFLGSAGVALGALLVGWRLGVLHGDSPEWTWVTAILLIDVAHVYSTAFRVYFDPAEFRRRRWLYVLTPLLAFAGALTLYGEGSQIFWRVLAYLAVFHFVRQQYGWVALYRGKAGEPGGVGKWIDTTAVYAATLFPLLYWHAHLPRKFHWFLPGDFAQVPAVAASIAEPVYWTVMAAYLGRSLFRGFSRGAWNPGKDIVVFTTAVCWYVGIITFNSDYAFTVTNVIIHGVPYMVLVYWYQIHRPAEANTWGRHSCLPRSAGRKACPTIIRPAGWKACPTIVVFLATVWLFAYVEELFWHRGIDHEHAWLFGPGWEIPTEWKGALVAALAVPQITHYVLDGFIWRRRSNPDVAATIGR